MGGDPAATSSADGRRYSHTSQPGAGGMELRHSYEQHHQSQSVSPERNTNLGTRKVHVQGQHGSNESVFLCSPPRRPPSRSLSLQARKALGFSPASPTKRHPAAKNGKALFTLPSPIPNRSPDSAVHSPERPDAEQIMSYHQRGRSVNSPSVSWGQPPSPPQSRFSEGSGPTSPNRRIGAASEHGRKRDPPQPPLSPRNRHSASHVQSKGQSDSLEPSRTSVPFVGFQTEVDGGWRRISRDPNSLTPPQERYYYSNPISSRPRPFRPTSPEQSSRIESLPPPTRAPPKSYEEQRRPSDRSESVMHPRSRQQSLARGEVLSSPMLVTISVDINGADWRFECDPEYDPIEEVQITRVNLEAMTGERLLRLIARTIPNPRALSGTGAHPVLSGSIRIHQRDNPPEFFTPEMPAVIRLEPQMTLSDVLDMEKVEEFVMSNQSVNRSHFSTGVPLPASGPVALAVRWVEMDAPDRVTGSHSRRGSHSATDPTRDTYRNGDDGDYRNVTGMKRRYGPLNVYHGPSAAGSAYSGEMAQQSRHPESPSALLAPYESDGSPTYEDVPCGARVEPPQRQLWDAKDQDGSLADSGHGNACANDSMINYLHKPNRPILRIPARSHAG